MNTLDKLNDVPQTFWGRMKCFLVSMFIPKYLRRAILMCSLAARLTNAERGEYEKLAAQVCSELELDYAYGHAAMVSPMQWNSKIWTGLPSIDLEHQTRGENLAIYARSVFSSIPRSLVYSSNRVMLDDIYRTIRAVGRRRALAA